MPSGVRTNVAWWREASTSGITMSLSPARPIVTEPASFAGAADRCDRNFTNLVARFDTSPDRAPTTVISVGATTCGGGAEPALTTVISVNGRVGGLRDTWTSVGWSSAGCCGGLREYGAGGCRGAGGRADLGPPRREPPLWPGGCERGCAGGGGVDHEMVDGSVSRGDPAPGGRPARPGCCASSKLSCGPPALPMLMLWPSWMSITGLR